LRQTEQAIVDALRNRRTVVVDRDGNFYGDPELIRVSKTNGGLPPSGVVPRAGAWSTFSRIAALSGMLAALLWGFKYENDIDENANRKLPFTFRR
jgi:hypothetical protein